MSADNHNRNKPEYLIIPAAGLGTRMKSVDANLPKELLPIAHKPAIQYTVEEGIAAGIKNIIFIISREKEIIRRFFTNTDLCRELFPKAIQDLDIILQTAVFSFLYQKEPLGESDAISYAKDIALNSPVAIIYPDNLYMPAPGALKILSEVYAEHQKDVIALTEVSADNAENISHAGIVDVEPVHDPLFNIVRFLPKKTGVFIPRYENELRACGIGVSGPYLFDCIERTRGTAEDKEFTDFPVRTLILKERGTLGYRLPGVVFDIGNPQGYRQCTDYINQVHEKG